MCVTVFTSFFENKAEDEDAEPVKKEKTHFLVKLTELKPEHKVKLIKEVKTAIQGLNLVQVSVAFTAVSKNLAEILFL